ncbi:hypothetical protein L2E82_32829 [Cichorium intybus]|uniref:Uncharacterized protein n=1 Tax=Cichorium intybus TaxID=13427 RepID=A0ACB9BIP7_CICIN|nr:hypothetical protein L2E82_32829 [Cichorium intybus]
MLPEPLSVAMSTGVHGNGDVSSWKKREVEMESMFTAQTVLRQREEEVLKGLREMQQILMGNLAKKGVSELQPGHRQECLSSVKDIAGNRVPSDDPNATTSAHTIVSCNFVFVYSLHLYWQSTQMTQIGTVTEAIEVVKMAKDAEWGVVISQRSGETDDCFIADLAVDLPTGHIKAGAPSRGSNVKEKQNQIQTIPVLRTGRT